MDFATKLRLKDNGLEVIQKINQFVFMKDLIITTKDNDGYLVQSRIVTAGTFRIRKGVLIYCVANASADEIIITNRDNALVLIHKDIKVSVAAKDGGVVTIEKWQHKLSNLT